MMFAVLRFVLNSIFFLLLLAGACVAFSLSPLTGQYRAFVVQSGSMEPALKTGSLIVVKSRNEYQVGDIVTRITKVKGVTITHRIVSAQTTGDGTAFRTKGDANEIEDGEAVKRADIVGNVRLSVPYLGYPVHFAKTPLGYVLLVVVPAVMIIFDEAFNIWTTLRARRQAKTETIRIRKVSFSDERERGGVSTRLLDQPLLIPVITPAFVRSSRTHKPKPMLMW